ncbi:MAG: type I restriction enzyme HsdR N-terminal domain-containing protein [Candidatus Aminicenantales bacterium]
MEKDLKKRLKLFTGIFAEAQEQGKREADVVMYVVQFFKDALGYDVFTEISKEFQIKEKYCDIAIKLQGQVELLIEVKQAGLRLADRHIEQAENYAMKSGAKWVLLTNGVEWKLFHLSYSDTEGIERAVVFRIDLLRDFKEKPDEVAEKFCLLQKKNYQKGALENYWKKKTMLEPGALAKALFAQPVLRALNREVNRGAKAKVGFDDIVKALKNLLDKEILADLADIKIRKRRRAKRQTPRKPKEPKHQESKIEGTKEKPGISEEEEHGP